MTILVHFHLPKILAKQILSLPHTELCNMPTPPPHAFQDPPPPAHIALGLVLVSVKVVSGTS